MQLCLQCSHAAGDCIGPPACKERRPSGSHLRALSTQLYGSMYALPIAVALAFPPKLLHNNSLS
jgi:hypothetical protein